MKTIGISKSFFKSVLAIVLFSGYVCNAVPDITIDCKDFEGLCAGETYQTTCTAPEDVKYHKLKVSDCSDKIEVDFLKSDSIDQTECDSNEMCGQFCGILKQVTPNMTIDMEFIATNNLAEASVICFGQSLTTAYQKTCSPSLAVIPHPPTNVQVSDCLPTFISWNEPEILFGKADEELKYKVSIEVNGKFKEFIVRDTFMKVETQSGSMYQVCVSSVNCAGLSEPVCTIGNLKSFLTPPRVNAVIINSTTVEVALSPNHNESLTGLCFDIEKDFTIETECTTGNSALVHIGKSNTVHAMRARTRMGEMTGDWSRVACVVVSPPNAVLFHNYTVIDESNIIVTLRLQPIGNVISNCQAFPTSKLQVTTSDGISIDIDIEDGETEKIVSLNYSNEAEEVALTVVAVNSVGTSPENTCIIAL